MNLLVYYVFRKNHWCYASYMYMKDLFQNTPSIWKAVDWSLFGYKEYNGEQSTLWVGSDGAYTPCHQDTYGYNLVAQICGLKQWILFAPDSSDILKATRIPFEESSVFSEVDIMDPDIMKRGLQVDDLFHYFSLSMFNWKIQISKKLLKENCVCVTEFLIPNSMPYHCYWLAVCGVMFGQ